MVFQNLSFEGFEMSLVMEISVAFYFKIVFGVRFVRLKG